MGDKFVLPDLDNVEDANTVKSHFQPGKILKAAQAEREAKKQKLPPVSEVSSKQPKENSTERKNEPLHIETSSVSTNYVTANVQASAFESAFGNLKSSKYYENPYPVGKSQPSSTKQSEQVSSAEKCAPKSNSVIVNPRQRGNPLLKHIRSVPWEHGEIEPDYVMGQTTCAFYLSLRYHSLYPNYIHDRLKSLGRSYELRVLMVHVDVIDPYPALRELSQIAILANCTLMLVWSSEEAGRCIETYKIFENKSAEMIMEKQEKDKYSQLIDSLSSVKSINRTNAVTLLSTFGTFENIVKASTSELSLCPGMGMQKANRLHEVLHQPILKSEKL